MSKKLARVRMDVRTRAINDFTFLNKTVADNPYPPGTTEHGMYIHYMSSLKAMKGESDA